MAKKFIEPEDRMKAKLGPLSLRRKDVYDVLYFTIRKHGLKAVLDELHNYFMDMTDTAYSGLNAETFCYKAPEIIGIGEARAWDVCLCLMECLKAKSEEYDLDKTSRAH